MAAADGPGTLEPGGRGPLASRGTAFYDRLVDALLEAGIAPHLDHPERALVLSLPRLRVGVHAPGRTSPADAPPTW